MWEVYWKKYQKRIGRTWLNAICKIRPNILLQGSYGNITIRPSDAVLLRVAIRCDCNLHFWTCYDLIIIITAVVFYIIIIHQQLQRLKLLMPVLILFKVVLFSASSFRSYEFSSSLSVVQCKFWQVIFLFWKLSSSLMWCRVIWYVAEFRGNQLHPSSCRPGWYFLFSNGLNFLLIDRVKNNQLVMKSKKYGRERLCSNLYHYYVVSLEELRKQRRTVECPISGTKIWTLDFPISTQNHGTPYVCLTYICAHRNTRTWR